MSTCRLLRSASGRRWSWPAPLKRSPASPPPLPQAGEGNKKEPSPPRRGRGQGEGDSAALQRHAVPSALAFVAFRLDFDIPAQRLAVVLQFGGVLQHVLVRLLGGFD